MPFAILWPTFALVALIFVVWLVLFVQRFAHLKRNPPSDSDLASGESAKRYFGPVEMPANNLANLFEMPVLYFALVPLLMLTQHGNHIQAILAWVFVGLRAVHSFIHIGPKKVPARFLVYLLSCAVLLAMWIGFFIDMLHAASLYHAAMSRMGAM
ncbi:MAG: MAPEG family protein [Sphingomonas sp.]